MKRNLAGVHNAECKQLYGLKKAQHKQCQQCAKQKNLIQNAEQDPASIECQKEDATRRPHE